MSNLKEKKRKEKHDIDMNETNKKELEKEACRC
jgi:hypothetical protein